MGERRVFTKEFKERAVELALNTNRKRPEIAQEFGINRNMPARWIREMKRSETGPMKAFTGRGNDWMKRWFDYEMEVPTCGISMTSKKAIAVFTAGNPR